MRNAGAWHRGVGDERLRRLLTGSDPQAPGERECHGEDAERTEADHPVLAGVGSHAEGVCQRYRPAGVGEPVDAPPGGGLETRPEQARDEHGSHEIEGNGPDPDPEPAVRRLSLIHISYGS